MATITIQLGEDLVHELAAAIVKLQTGGTVRPPENQPDTWPSGPADDDPWSTPGPGASSPSAATTAPPGPASAPPAPAAMSVEIVNTPKGAQTWTLNHPSAPVCGCGRPSAHIQGSTNGRAWARYGCALGKDKATFRNKCDFSQWA